MEGGKKKLSFTDRDGRSFKVVQAKSLGKGKYKVSAHAELSDNAVKIYGKTTKGKEKKNKPTPEMAAKKILKRLCREVPKSASCIQKLVLMETTRGSQHRLYFYEGKRVKLDKPRVHIFPGNKKVVYEFEHVVKSADEKKLGHSSILSDWKP